MKKKSKYWIFHFWEIRNEFFNTQTVLFYKPVGGMPSWSSRCSSPCSSSSTKSMPCPIMCLHRWVSIKRKFRFQFLKLYWIYLHSSDTWSTPMFQFKIVCNITFSWKIIIRLALCWYIKFTKLCSLKLFMFAETEHL